jgi:hypothetical protein
MSHGLNYKAADSGLVGTNVKQPNQMMNFDDRKTEYLGIAYRDPVKSIPNVLNGFFSEVNSMRRL